MKLSRPPLSDGNSQQQEYYRALGEVVAVMLQSKTHRGYQVAAIGIWVDPALLLDQILIAYDENGDPYAYVCWAMISKEVLSKLTANPDTLLHISEWNEGEIIWIMDLAYRPGTSLRAVRAFMRNLEPHTRFAYPSKDSKVNYFPKK